MYKETARLMMYGDLGEDSILLSLAEIFEKAEAADVNKDTLVRDIYTPVIVCLN